MIFLDTGFLFALVNKRDENHARVLAVMHEYQSRDLRRLALTTNHVVEETITLIKANGHHDPGFAHDVAVRAGRKLYDGAFGEIHHVMPSEERAAFELLARHRDKKYSLTDCISFVIMDAHGITEALTVDGDFTHRYVAKPGPIKR